MHFSKQIAFFKDIKFRKSACFPFYFVKTKRLYQMLIRNMEAFLVSHCIIRFEFCVHFLSIK
jgi:hypothetical protein